MKLIKKHEEWNYAEYTYEHNGYTIEETRYSEDDCYHHLARVLKGEQELVSFSGNSCLKDAQEYIDAKCFKALETIKEKRVDTSDFIHSKNLIDYNDGRSWRWYLTQEEYDLLKEVLL